MKPAIFLDRDGTLCESPPKGEYPIDPAKMRVFGLSKKFIRCVSAMGLMPVIVTNQACIRHGLATPTTVQMVHVEFERQLGIVLPLYMCYHRPEDNCECRKPKPGMLLEAAEALDIDLSRSIMVGDNDTDVQAGRAAGCALSFKLTVPGDCGGPGSLSHLLLHLNDLYQADLLP